MTKNDTSNWLRTNLWNLLITAALFIVAFTTIQLKQAAMAQELSNLEKTVAEYPSKDYFELKFQTIDEKIVNLNKTLNKHMGIE
jgi:hypothetical protein